MWHKTVQTSKYCLFILFQKLTWWIYWTFFCEHPFYHKHTYDDQKKVIVILYFICVADEVKFHFKMKQMEKIPYKKQPTKQLTNFIKCQRITMVELLITLRRQFSNFIIIIILCAHSTDVNDWVRFYWFVNIVLQTFSIDDFSMLVILWFLLLHEQFRI